MRPRLDRRHILGIVGESAAGKTTLANGIAAILGQNRVTIICSDDYHRYARAERAENGLSALDRKAKIGPNLNVRHTLRPTLPHPDLTPIRDVGGRNGFQPRLARDIDGKPVDIMEVSGDIDGKRAAEDSLWSPLPEAHHLRINVGKYVDEMDAVATSHLLALSQLCITYHLVKGAMGAHAI